jgi:hypothetical protein
MLDPLSALSVAASVVQFLDFTRKTVNQAHDLNSKSAVTVDYLKRIANDLKDLSFFCPT